MNEIIYSGLCHYFYAGLIYAAIVEYKYRTSDYYEPIEFCWWAGDLFQLIFHALYHSVAWFPLIVLDMRKSYLSSKQSNEEDL